MRTTRRGFLALAGGIGAAAMAGRVTVTERLRRIVAKHRTPLPDDVWCPHCRAWQLPNHIAVDGASWHESNGAIWVRVSFEDGRPIVQPWPGGPPQKTGGEYVFMPQERT